MFRRLRFILPIVVVFLFVSQALWNSDGENANKWYTDSAVAGVFRPVAAFIDRVTGAVSGTLNKYVFLVGIEEERNLLKEELDKAKLENAFLREELSQLKEFRAAALSLGFKHDSYLGAKILAQDLFHASKTVLIDKGKNHGIKVDNVVVTGEGLVGRVLHTYEDTSKILLVIDPAFSVDAVNIRTGVRVLVSGLSETRLKSKRMPFFTQVEYLENAREMLKGDPVVTSGLGYVFPRGIPVGMVDKVEYSTRQLFDKALVLPAVDFTKLTHVYVVKGDNRVSDERKATAVRPGIDKPPEKKNAPTRSGGRGR